MNSIRCIAMSVAIASVIFPVRAEPLAGALVTASKSDLPTAFRSLPGRWVRPDGGYVIAIKSVDAGGKLEASYANPNPLPF